jgi:hypothetical protein
MIKGSVRQAFRWSICRAGLRSRIRDLSTACVLTMFLNGCANTDLLVGPCLPALFISPAGPFSLFPNTSSSLALQLSPTKGCVNTGVRNGPTDWTSSDPDFVAIGSHTDSTVTVIALVPGSVDITARVPTTVGVAQAAVRVIVAPKEPG